MVVRLKVVKFAEKIIMIAEYNSVFDELAFFLASLSPRRVLAYKASDKAQARVKDLLEKKTEHQYNT